MSEQLLLGKRDTRKVQPATYNLELLVMLTCRHEWSDEFSSSMSNIM